MRSFKQIASTVRGEDVLEEGKKSLGTGWMLKADPKLGKAVKDKIDLAKKRQATYGDKSAGKSVKEEVELAEADAKDYHSVHVNGRHWKTFDTKSHAENVAKKVKGATVHKYDAERLQQNYGAKAAARNAARGKQYDESVEVEQLDEMPGANMDTRAVHQHLKKRGWKLSRTSGSHDVYTHSDAKHHIPVPRHRQLKAPLVKGILKQAEINEQAESDTTQKTEMAQTQLHFIKYAAEEILEFIEMGGEVEEWYQNKLSKVMSDVESLHSYVEGEARRTGMKEEVVTEDKDYDDRMKKALDRAKTATPKKPADEYDRKVEKYLKKKHGMKEEVVQTSNSNENPNAGRFMSGPAKKPMKPAPIVTAEQTATDLGKERYEVPFEGPYAKNTAKVTTDRSGAKHTAMSRVKHLAKMAARKQAGLKEEQEPEDSYEKTSTPARRSLSKTAGIVKDLAKNSKSSSKEKADTFQAEPELSSQIIKT